MRLPFAVSQALVALALAAAFAVPASAQDFHHPVPWVAEDALVCVRSPTSMTRAELDAHLASARTGQVPAPALELAASCAVPRRQIAEALNDGGLVRHRAGDFAASVVSFEEAVVADPSFLAARFNYACALARLGRTRAAGTEIGEIARAGDAGRRWLRRVDVDPDLASIRDDEDVRSFVRGDSSLYQAPPIPTPGVPVPAIAGPRWEPLADIPWATFRAVLAAYPSFESRRALRPAEDFPITHPSLDGLEVFSTPGFFRPERGHVFLVVPFSIPGPNHRDGFLMLHWNGVAFESSCFEYCQWLSPPGHRDRRYFTARPNEIRVVRCGAPNGGCTTFLVQTDGRVARHRMSGLLPDVTMPAPAPAP